MACRRKLSRHPAFAKGKWERILDAAQKNAEYNSRQRNCLPCMPKDENYQDLYSCPDSIFCAACGFAEPAHLGQPLYFHCVMCKKPLHTPVICKMVVRTPEEDCNVCSMKCLHAYLKSSLAVE